MGGPPALPPASLGKLRGKQGGISAPSAGKDSSSIRTCSPTRGSTLGRSRRAGKPLLSLGLYAARRTHGAWRFTCAHCACMRICAHREVHVISGPAAAPNRPCGPHALGCRVCRKAFTLGLHPAPLAGAAPVRVLRREALGVPPLRMAFGKCAHLARHCGPHSGAGRAHTAGAAWCEGNSHCTWSFHLLEAGQTGWV